MPGSCRPLSFEKSRYCPFNQFGSEPGNILTLINIIALLVSSPRTDIDALLIFSPLPIPLTLLNLYLLFDKPKAKFFKVLPGNFCYG